MGEKLANPGPLGLMGFGMTTVLLNLYNAGFYPLGSMILAMGLAYDGLAQMIAGMMEYKRGDTFGAVAFSSYGLFSWFLVALLIFLKSVSGILFRRLRFNLHPTLQWLHTSLCGAYSLS